ncbi:bifunctional nuclease family protein [Natranaerobius thermophilus]|uniref:BFN domain-containing protein n=1 Tax=Natranaerobius thermophilus (strain ATCC BAA-1301 / DSM 18059 / JW/NM-WN-LF) TaxID=457570 RepID=B2A720_NATTJ|nr:bifunctional nuclease family protein [Natranaerobius thermophilus]ACB85611.1 protein of unknown function DUF151 [Natranaerobius thermophilus JW/NM-WN-LF]
MFFIIQVKVKGIGTSQNGESYAVLLSDMEETKILPIVVGSYEAQGIISALKGQQPPRPMTYDLTKSMCDHLGGDIEKIVITEVKDDIFYANIYLSQDKTETFQIDSRPSDAIAMALRYEAPIYINFQLIEFTCDYEDLIDEQNDAR